MSLEVIFSQCLYRNMVTDKTPYFFSHKERHPSLSPFLSLLYKSIVLFDSIYSLFLNFGHY